jgi:hypothetical protein
MMTVNDDLEKLIENFFFLQEHLNQHVYRDPY